MSGIPAVEASGLRKLFGSVEALRGVSFSVETGEVFGIVGPDGAGKTTCMRILAAVLRPDGGTARIAGFDTLARASAVKNRIGYMSQRFGLYQDLTVDENMAFYADLYGVSARDAGGRISRLLEMSAMGPFRRRRAGRLSGGMKQKLGLMCALVHTPEVLLLDEPTNGVDPVSRRGFWRMLHELVEQGLTVVVSTSYLDEAERCDRLALMSKGSITAVGTPAELEAMSGEAMIEVVTPSVREAAGLLEGAFPGSRAVLFGDRVHLSFGSAAPPTVSEVAGVLSGRVVFESVEPCRPSLEDVFVSIGRGGG